MDKKVKRNLIPIISASIAAMSILIFGYLLGCDHRSAEIRACHSAQASLQKDLDAARKQNTTDKMQQLKELSELAKRLSYVLPSPGTLDWGTITLQMSMGSLEEMKKAERSLQDLILGCSKTALCPKGLEKRIEIEKGSLSYFLVLHSLTQPDAARVYNLFWNSEFKDWWTQGAVFVQYDKDYLK